MSKLICLGTGSAFAMKNFHSNYLLEHEGQRMLIDAGSDIRWSLVERGFTYKDFNSIYISHLHSDHSGGLEFLGFVSYFTPKFPKYKLYLSEALKDDIWSKTLSGGMGSLEGKVCDLQTYFDVQAIKKNESFVWNGLTIIPVQTVHFMNGFVVIPSFGLIIKKNGYSVFLTTDTQFCPNQIKVFYDMCDIIIHDCETGPYKSGVHAHFSELITLSEDVKKKMYLTHYNDNVLDDFEGWQKKANHNGLAGFLKKGQILEF